MIFISFKMVLLMVDINVLQRIRSSGCAIWSRGFAMDASKAGARWCSVSCANSGTHLSIGISYAAKMANAGKQFSFASIVSSTDLGQPSCMDASNTGTCSVAQTPAPFTSAFPSQVPWHM